MTRRRSSSPATHSFGDGHETEFSVVGIGSASVLDQVSAGPPGSVEAIACPLTSTATQYDRGTHARPGIASSAILTLCHSPAAPVGLLELTASPFTPAATHSDADGHDTASRPAPGSFVTCHALAPPPGSREVTIRFPSAVTHRAALAHETPAASFEFDGSPTFTALHALRPPVGLAETTARPPLSTATHSDGDAHDTAVRESDTGTAVRCQAPAPPAGAVEVKIGPALSIATHSDAVGHETPLSSAPESIVANVHRALPPAGSVEVTTSPVESVAAQNDREGQDTLVNPAGFIPEPPLAVRKLMIRHAGVRAAASVDVRMFPLSSAATHSDRDGHETLSSVAPVGGSTRMGVDQREAGVAPAEGTMVMTAISAPSASSAQGNALTASTLAHSGPSSLPIAPQSSPLRT